MGRLFFLALFLLAACGRTPLGVSNQPSSSGDWVSSGGERIRDSQNPWWLKNVTNVQYCIAIDPLSFSASRATVQKTVAGSLAYWKNETSRRVLNFEDPYQLLKNWNHIGVGAQEFVEGPCDGHEDISFRFGIGTLTVAERNYIGSPTRFVAITVRQSYDRETLRGKGFVYLGPDLGPEASEAQAPKVWSYPAALNLALVHELGHVFGIPHTGNRFSLMGASILEQITSREFGPFLAGIDYSEAESPSFFLPKTKWHSCGASDVDTLVWNRFFGTSAKKQCLEIEFLPHLSRYEIKSYDKGEKARVEVGGLEAARLVINSWPVSGILLFLSPLQKVFDFKVDSKPSLLTGPFFVSGEGGALFRTKNGHPKPVRLILGPEQFTLSGDLEGSNVTIINWNTRAY